MATLTQANPRAYKGHMETVKLLITNGQSWNAGQFLHTASGALSATATGSVNFKYVAKTTQADPGNTTTTAEVWVITNDVIFEGNELDATAAVQTWIGGIYNINVASNVVTVDVDSTSVPSVEIVDVAYLYEPIKNSAADTNPLVTFRVLQSVLDAAGS